MSVFYFLILIFVKMIEPHIKTEKLVSFRAKMLKKKHGNPQKGQDNSQNQYHWN